MANEQEPIKIEIPVEEEPLVPQQEKQDVKGAVGRAGKQVARIAGTAVKKVWRSEARKKVTSEVGRGVKVVVAKGSKTVSDVMVRTAERQAKQTATAVQNRVQTTDWKQVAKVGTASGLRWVSRKLAHLAARFTSQEKKAEVGIEPVSKEE